MFLGYGQPAEDERLRFYGNLTQHVPIDVLECAMRAACIESAGSFPPGPGAIVQQALVLVPGAYTPGQSRSLPRWYQRATHRLRSDERPLEIGARTGDSKVRDVVDVVARRAGVEK